MLSFKQYLNELNVRMPGANAGLGIKRGDMPQIASKDYTDYVSHLKKNGITLTSGDMNPDDLKPIQKEFSRGKVENSIDYLIKALKNDEQIKPIIVSKDNYVVDGHHRWIAHQNAKMMIPVVKANVNMKKLLRVTHEFPKVTYKGIK